MIKSHAALFTGLATLFCLPSLASAHLVTTGLGPVYDGIGHLFMTPEDIIPALTLVLFAGLRGTLTSKRTLFLLPLAWFAGGVVGIFTQGLPPLSVAPLTILTLGGLVAVDMKLSSLIFTVLLLVVGFAHGVVNGIALQEGPGILGLIGISASLFVLVALFSALVVSVKQPWMRITVRIAGSWVAAIGMLMFGWIFRGQL